MEGWGLGKELWERQGLPPIIGTQRPGHCEGLCWVLSPQFRTLLLPPLDGSGGRGKGKGHLGLTWDHQPEGSGQALGGSAHKPRLLIHSQTRDAPDMPLWEKLGHVIHARLPLSTGTCSLMAVHSRTSMHTRTHILFYGGANEAKSKSFREEITQSPFVG